MLPFCHLLLIMETANADVGKTAARMIKIAWSHTRSGRSPVAGKMLSLSHSLSLSFEFSIVVSPAGADGLVACDKQRIPCDERCRMSRREVWTRRTRDAGSCEIFRAGLKARPGDLG
jgi:hypothetical protein